MKYPEIQKVMDSNEAYDFVAQYNTPIHGGGSEGTRKLLEMCQLDDKSHVLDVGCGAGHTACFIAEKYGSRVIGIDISENMIKMAKKRARKKKMVDKVEFQVTDVFQLPFKENSFDAVIIESVLTPLPDEAKALVEITRIIRSGGLVGANEAIFDPSTPPEVIELLAKHPSFSGRIITSQSLKEMFAEAGLEIVHFTEETFKISIMKEMGVRGIISFMVRVYPKLMFKLIADSGFRKYVKLDDEVKKVGEEHSSFGLIVGKKPE
ncbi:MAG: class I SAM-dependent methyltransferase [Candidatus Odinarchaeota archaeon]